MCVPQVYFDKWVVINDPLIAFRSFQGHTKILPVNPGSTARLMLDTGTGKQELADDWTWRYYHLSSSCSAWFLYFVA